jgi:predicted negative regulator of RcsB-dependent stress response
VSLFLYAGLKMKGLLSQLLCQFLCRLVTFVALLGSAALATASLAEDELLKQRYLQLLHQAYQEGAANLDLPTFGPQEYDRLIKFLSQCDEAHFVPALLANAELFSVHFDRTHGPDIVRRLLQKDAYILAKSIREQLAAEGSRYLLARLDYEFAAYHSDRQEWQQAEIFLVDDYSANTLGQHERDHLNVIKGLLLQQKKKHRQSEKPYAAVASGSQYYPVAQLNLATAYIRQDWWTDAHYALQNGIRSASDTELKNRLRTVLGFSQLQRELFRDARASFRQVRSDSRYSLRAFFGLAVAALHEKDYPGALNAFRRIKGMTPYDKSAAESFLLTAIALERMNKGNAASASFTEAIAYYDNYMLNLEHALATMEKPDTEYAVIDSALRDGIRSFTSELPSHLAAANRNLALTEGLGLSPELRKDITQVSRDYEHLHKRLFIQRVNHTLSVLNSYLNQAQFGLARLHDTAAE